MTRQEHTPGERHPPMPPAGMLPSLRIPPTRLPTLKLTRAEKACLAISLGVILLGAGIWVTVAGSSSDPQPADPWPAIVRTVDGTPTTPMPEDLDR